MQGPDWREFGGQEIATHEASDADVFPVRISLQSEIQRPQCGGSRAVGCLRLGWSCAHRRSRLIERCEAGNCAPQKRWRGSHGRRRRSSAYRLPARDGPTSLSHLQLPTVSEQPEFAEDGRPAYLRAEHLHRGAETSLFCRPNPQGRQTGRSTGGAACQI